MSCMTAVQHIEMILMGHRNRMRLICHGKVISVIPMTTRTLLEAAVSIFPPVSR